MCDQQRLRPACAYAQSDQSLCLSLVYSMSVKLLTEHHLEYLSLKETAKARVSLHLSKKNTLLEIACHRSNIDHGFHKGLESWKNLLLIALQFRPVQEISYSVVCATSKGSDQPAHTRSLIRAFSSRFYTEGKKFSNIL